MSILFRTFASTKSSRTKNPTIMKKEKEEKPRIRKEYSPDGTRGQKMVTFRCDLENLEWLESQPNKGRAINNLIAKERGA